MPQSSSVEFICWKLNNSQHYNKKKKKKKNYEMLR
jgi:hypothetical protein